MQELARWMAEWLGWTLLSMEMHDVTTGLLDLNNVTTSQWEPGTPKYEKLKQACTTSDVMVIVPNPEPFLVMQVDLGWKYLRTMRGVIVQRSIVDAVRKHRDAVRKQQQEQANG